MSLKFQTVKNIVTKITGMQVSEKAVKEFGKVLEEYIEKIATQSAEFAKHAKRVKIQPEDVKLALEVMKRN